MGEADVDGDAALLLLGQAIAIDAGEGLDERGLAVIDMAGGAEDQVAQHVDVLRSRYFSISVADMADRCTRLIWVARGATRPISDSVQDYGKSAQARRICYGRIS